MGYACNATLNYTCTVAGVGEGAFKSQSACETGCKKPAQQYKCDPKTLSCVEAPLGTPGTASQAQAVSWHPLGFVLRPMEARNTYIH